MLAGPGCLLAALLQLCAQELADQRAASLLAAESLCCVWSCAQGRLLRPLQVAGLQTVPLCPCLPGPEG